MELKNFKCSVCGEPLGEPINGYFKCACCNSTFKEETANKEIEKILVVLDNDKQERLANARKNLFNVTHETYLSRERIKDAVNRVKELYPDDIMANFYDSFLIGKEATLSYLENFDFINNLSYLKQILDFILRKDNLNLIFVSPLKRIINNFFNFEDKPFYDELIEKCAEKLNKGIYNLNIERDVFICYEKKDKDIATELVNDIEKQGLTCFAEYRNMKHDIGSAENHDENIYKAMEHCKCIFFVSSHNSRNVNSETFLLELPYLKDRLHGKKIIEYVFEDYDANDNEVVADFIKQIFKNGNIVKNKEDVISILSKVISELKNEDSDDVSSNDEHFKYCINCFTKNPFMTRHCIKCDCDIFAPNLEEAKKMNAEKDSYSKKENIREEFKYCSKCKAKNSLDAKFCLQCGSSSFVSNIDNYTGNDDNNLKYCVKCLAGNALATKFCQNCGNTMFASTLQEAKIQKEKCINKGSVITFGSYPQSLDTPEPIEWDVLDVKEGKAFLLSHKVLDAHRFAMSSNNYASSEIRSWLNNDFYNKAFTSEQKNRIVISDVDNSPRSTNPFNNASKWNRGLNQYSSSNTQDKVFLLSEYEITNSNYGFIEETSSQDSNRVREVTPYAAKKGAYVSNNNGYYFLRSPCCTYSGLVWICDNSGKCNIYNYAKTVNFGVVPALWIKL